MTDAATVLRVLGILVAAPPVVDSLARRALARAAARAGAPVPGGRVDRWLVVVPAREEGEGVAGTLASIARAAGDTAVEMVLLLDGPDTEAARVGEAHGARVLVKEPAGPTKGAALAWLADRHPELVASAGAVLVVDVGSELVETFFEGADWPDGAGAVQAWLRGVGRGVGDAVSLSEALAQGIEDRGRQALGWNVHLRGTGTAFIPEAFSRTVSRLRTAVEDTEATLLLAAEGERTVMMGPAAVVRDLKPSSVGMAARQRARWLLGELALPVRQPGALARWLRRRPVEGACFLAGLLSRPLALSGALRMALAAAFAVDAVVHGSPFSWVVAGALALTLLSDLLILRRATGMPWSRLGGTLAGLLAAWIGAVLLLPRAALGWIRGRR